MCISCFSEQRKPIQPAPHPPTGDSLGGRLKGGVGLAPGSPRSGSGRGRFEAHRGPGCPGLSRWGLGGGEGARLCLQSSCKPARRRFAPGRRARRGEEINPLPRSENDCLWCTHCCLPSDLPVPKHPRASCSHPGCAHKVTGPGGLQARGQAQSFIFSKFRFLQELLPQTFPGLGAP